MSFAKLKPFVIIFAIPALALAIFARQVYLQVSHDLSIWKGGGMGMFAGIGAPSHRFLKIYVLDRYGNRAALTNLTSEQRELKERLRTEPSTRNYEILARALMTTRWSPQAVWIKGQKIDSSGKLIGYQKTPHIALAPAGPIPMPGSVDEPSPNVFTPRGIEVEFWKIDYSGSTKELSAELVNTLVAER